MPIPTKASGDLELDETQVGQFLIRVSPASEGHASTEATTTKIEKVGGRIVQCARCRQPMTQVGKFWMCGECGEQSPIDSSFIPTAPPAITPTNPLPGDYVSVGRQLWVITGHDQYQEPLQLLN